MKKTYVNVADIVHKFKEDQRVTYIQFAEEMSRILGKHDNIAYNTVSMWGTGRNNPDYWMLVHLAKLQVNWISGFAFSCLKRMRPDIWEKKKTPNDPD